MARSSQCIACKVDTLVTWRLAAVEGLTNFCHEDGGDGYTEWYRGVTGTALREHVLVVIRIVRAMWGGPEPELGLK